MFVAITWSLVFGLMFLIFIIADQSASESSFPLSPQWLYARPTEPKMV